MDRVRLRLRTNGLHWREIDGEIIALESESATYLAANRSATVLWRALEAGATREQLIQALVDKYNVSGEIAERDVGAFVAEMQRRELVEEAAE